jgi:HAD superfamily hydrolase (TIGR01509 family)
MKRVRGVILDVDGTLVDSNDAHACAWIEALAERGLTVPFNKVRKLIGMGGDKLLPAACGLSEDSPESKQVSQRRKEIFKSRYLPSLRPFAGARELLRRMHDHGLKLVVASSAREDELRPLLELCGANGLIETAASSDEADQSRPDPNIVQAALKELQLPAAEVVLLGDTPCDAEAAQRAGVRMIGLRCGGWGDADLAGAVALYHNPADLLQHYDESPLARA